MRRIATWAFAIAGWALAAYFFDKPTGTPCFIDEVPYINDFEPGGQRVVAWNEGKYEIFPNGVERVTPFWGPLTLAFDPGRGHCPQGVFVRPTGIAYSVCWEDKVGGAWGRREDLSSTAERILHKGRLLVERRWGVPVRY